MEMRKAFLDWLAATNWRRLFAFTFVSTFFTRCYRNASYPPYPCIIGKFHALQ